MIVAGTRDEGLMHTAQALTNPVGVMALETRLPSVTGDDVPALEALYEVTGVDRTNLDAVLVYSAPLDYLGIWGGELR